LTLAPIQLSYTKKNERQYLHGQLFLRTKNSEVWSLYTISSLDRKGKKSETAIWWSNNCLLIGFYTRSYESESKVLRKSKPLLYRAKPEGNSFFAEITLVQDNHFLEYEGKVERHHDEPPILILFAET